MNKFWLWYEKNIFLNQFIVSTLFIWQILHLYWLTTHVVVDKILGYSIFNPNELLQFLLVIADYLEIPALVSGNILYLYLLKDKSRRNLKKNMILLLLINTQWLHLFWITDKFVISHFQGGGEHRLIPLCLAWLAILIDYLELPVIYDVTKNTAKKLSAPNP